jgi:hypothetical protein
MRSRKEGLKMTKPMHKNSCCYECGRKKYRRKNLQNGITTFIGLCPFCKNEKMLIPASDWANRGD